MGRSVNRQELLVVGAAGLVVLTASGLPVAGLVAEAWNAGGEVVELLARPSL